MGKHDMPSLQMVVQGGHLVPSGPYEQEVIGSYQQGAVLTVDMHQKRTLPLLKKYWAVLRDVISNCKTPWNSTEEASDALKLALGVTDIGKTVSGQWFIRAGSISFNSMDQAAFKDFFDKSMAVLAGVTGIDPETLSKRYRHLAEHETPSGGAPPLDGQGSDDAPPPGSVVAADPSEPVGGPVPAGETEVAADQSTSSAGDLITQADRAWLKLVAKMLWAATGIGEQDVLKRQMAGIRENHTPATIGDTARAKANSINAKCKLVCFGEASAAHVLPLIAGIAGCETRDITT